MRVRRVARQIKLDGDAFPSRVSVRRDQVSRNVARQNRDWIHTDFGIAGAEAAFERRREPPYESLFHGASAERASHQIPNVALLRRQMPNIFWKEIDLHARVRAVAEVMTLAAAMHRPIVRYLWHIGQHQRGNV